MRIKMIQCTICLLAALPSAFVHPLNLFIAAARALVLLSTGNGDEGVNLRQRLRILSMSKYDARHRVRIIYLSGARSSCNGSAHSGEHSGYTVWLSRILLGPWVISLLRVALVLGHVVVGRVRRVWWVGRTRLGYGRIYRYLGIRLMWGIVMVILLSILQRHGRTFCLSHSSCTSVTLLLCVC